VTCQQPTICNLRLKVPEQGGRHDKEVVVRH
jgi:hypothetical protein